MLHFVNRKKCSGSSWSHRSPACFSSTSSYSVRRVAAKVRRIKPKVLIGITHWLVGDDWKVTPTDWKVMGGLEMTGKSQGSYGGIWLDSWPWCLRSWVMEHSPFSPCPKSFPKSIAPGLAVRTWTKTFGGAKMYGVCRIWFDTWNDSLAIHHINSNINKELPKKSKVFGSMSWQFKVFPSYSHRLVPVFLI